MTGEIREDGRDKDNSPVKDYSSAGKLHDVKDQNSVRDHYLFAHFREKRTPDGEQVHFALSEDGFHWEQVHGGAPVLESTVGERGVRDFVIYRTRENRFVILATDLCLANNFAGKYQSNWEIVNQKGSLCLVRWMSGDLIHWEGPELIPMMDDTYGCVWAPDIVACENSDDYFVHWSSVKKGDADRHMAIYGAFTKDFAHFTQARLYCWNPKGQIIDSNIVAEDGWYYRFLKLNTPDGHIYLERGRKLLPENPDGLSEHNGWTRLPAFDEEMSHLKAGQYEAPTAFRLAGGRWCLMLDYYGTNIPEKQGYVPFLCDDISTGRFVRSDAEFSFPYGFKHGTVLPVTRDEYDRVRKFYG